MQIIPYLMSILPFQYFFMSCICFLCIYSKRYKLSFHEEIMKIILKISHFKREGKGLVD